MNTLTETQKLLRAIPNQGNPAQKETPPLGHLSYRDLFHICPAISCNQLVKFPVKTYGGERVERECEIKQLNSNECIRTVYTIRTSYATTIS